MTKIGLNESTTVEFKQSLSELDEITVAVAAFANTDGGKIYIGVSDQ
jgi:predicted HTH transcriptional regulator